MTDNSFYQLIYNLQFMHF